MRSNELGEQQDFVVGLSLAMSDTYQWINSVNGYVVPPVKW